MPNSPIRTFASLLALVLASLAPTAHAQFDPLGFGGPAGDQPSHVTATADFTAGEDGQPARLFITAEITPGWHIYSITQKPKGPLKSEISIDDSPQFEILEPFRAIQAPAIHTYDDIWPGLPVEEHEGKVVWYAPIRIAEGVDPTQLTISGKLHGQVCQESCMFYDADFSAKLGEGVEIPTGPATAKSNTSLVLIVLSAMLGGLILNLMPCVLPVIGLKVLGFVQQAGENRARVLALNTSYAVGIVSVFLILATLAASVQLGLGSEDLGWGEQFTYTWFKVTMTALVFVMALSFLGVWDIPIPGFAGRGKASELAARENMSGAFFKGVFTTILATPCSGPFLGPVFAFTTRQPPQVTYLIFASVGLGMASPYLLIGAFPRLIAFVPKPGAWMDTFKQLMGFLLLATVVYLFSTLNATYVVPTLALLVALWFACWWIGRTPITASGTQKLTAWVGGAAVVALVGYLALVPAKYELDWQPYSPAALAQAQAEGKTVMVDFTASWCPTCKTNLMFAINRKDVKELVEKNGVVPMIADWSDRSDAIKQSLAELNSVSIPLLAIYPADNPQNPIVLRDTLWQSHVLEALEQAGPSKDAASPVSAAPSQ